MTRAVSAAAALFLSASVASSLSGCTGREGAIGAKPILRINHREISTKEFADALALRLKSFDALFAKDETNLARAKEQTVQAFVLETVARDFAKRERITVDPKELDAEAQSIRARYPDDTAFRRSLAEENLAFEAWRKSLDLVILQRKMFAKLTGKVPEPTDAQMKAVYDRAAWARPARVHLRQVVLAREDQAQRIHDQLLDHRTGGPNLTQLAKEFSIAPEGGSGGDIGWIEKGTLEVFDQAFKMKVGERSKVLRSPYGFHIFEVLAKEPEGHLSFTDAKARIRAQLMERGEQAMFTSWLEQQVRKASVFRDDALIQAIKVTTRGN